MYNIWMWFLQALIPNNKKMSVQHKYNKSKMSWGHFWKEDYTEERPGVHEPRVGVLNHMY